MFVRLCFITCKQETGRETLIIINDYILKMGKHLGGGQWHEDRNTKVQQS